MAIDRRDYQYVRNTLPGYGKGRADDEEEVSSTIKIGDRVTNLLPDLYDGMEVYAWDYGGGKPESFWAVEDVNNNGIYTEVFLTAGKTYVWQVLNLEIDNSYYGKDANNLEIIDNAFTYFTPKQSKNYTFAFDGVLATYDRLIYGRTIINQEGEVGDGCVSKNSNGHTKVKIYLFEADQPYYVNNNGVVSGIMPPCWLETLE